MATALDQGTSRSRLRAKDLARPWRGVRAAAHDADDLEQQCAALLLRLDSGAFLSHTTAARIMKLPLPLMLERESVLHVSVFDPIRPPEIAGVISHHYAAVPAGIRRWRGIPLSSPVLTWCMLGSTLGVPDLVAVADALVTGDPPLATVDQLSEAVDRRHGSRGNSRLKRALPLVRPGPLSRPETFARLIVVAAGLPEPEVNGKIFDADGRFLAMSDLVFRDQKVACEYEGDGHWSDARQFRKDILRRERVEDAGWRLTRITADDLRHRTAETVTRLAARLGLRLTRAGVARAVALAAQFTR